MTMSRGLAAGAGATLLALTLAACGSGSGGSSKDDAGGSGGKGVAATATKEEWVKAFESIDPVTIRTQSSAPKGSPSGRDWEAFMSHITEYSGGKVTFDIGFANAYAPPAEMTAALSDGRLDMGQVVPQYSAKELPKANAVVALGVLSDQSVVSGTVTSNVWPLEAAFKSGVDEEFDKLDMKMLIPYYNTGAGSLFCKEPHTDLAKLKGTVVAASGAKQSEQLRSLGASPTSIVFTEFYESLQRGAVDCAQTTATAGLQVGLGEIASNIVIDDKAGFIPGAGSIAFSKDTWNDMPLEAQQLVWDSIPIFLTGNLNKIWGNYGLLNAAATKAGGKITPFSDDARGVMENSASTISDQVAKDSGAEIVDEAKSAKAKWDKAAADAGITNDTDYSGLDAWVKAGKNQAALDFVAKQVYTAIYAPLRP